MAEIFAIKSGFDVRCKVKVLEGYVSIFRNLILHQAAGGWHHRVRIEDHLLSFSQPEKVFVGTSPPGPDFLDPELYLGNSLLLKLSGLRYVFIGTEIYEFTAPSPVQAFFSPVYRPCNPMPYAICEQEVILFQYQRIIKFAEIPTYMLEEYSECRANPNIDFLRLQMQQPRLGFNPVAVDDLEVKSLISDPSVLSSFFCDAIDQ